MKNTGKGGEREGMGLKSTQKVRGLEIPLGTVLAGLN